LFYEIDSKGTLLVGAPDLMSDNNEGAIFQPIFPTDEFEEDESDFDCSISSFDASSYPMDMDCLLTELETVGNVSLGCGIIEVDLVVNDLELTNYFSSKLDPSISDLPPPNSIMKDEFVDPSSSLHSFSFDLTNFTNRDPFTS